MNQNKVRERRLTTKAAERTVSVAALREVKLTRGVLRQRGLGVTKEQVMVVVKSCGNISPTCNKVQALASASRAPQVDQGVYGEGNGVCIRV